MKKLIVALLAVSLVSVSGFAHAAAVTRGGTAGGAGVVQSFNIGTEVFRLSNNVQLNINASSSDYTVVSGHLQGDAQYGSSSRRNTIMQVDKTKGDFEDLVEPASETTIGGLFADLEGTVEEEPAAGSGEE